MFNAEIYVNALYAILTWNSAGGAIFGVVKLTQKIIEKDK